MPIYEYTCKSCDAKFEQLQRTMNDNGEAKVKCPACGSSRTARALSVFAVGATVRAAGGAKSSAGTGAAASSAPGMCGRCGGPGPCPSGY